MNFGAHKLVPTEPFLDYRCQYLTTAATAV